jgi:hypothetical protein
MKRLYPVLLAAAFVSGCGDRSPEREATPSSPPTPATAVKAPQREPTPAPALTERLAEVKDAAQEAAAQVSARAGELLEQAQGLLEANKLQDVQGALKELGGMALSSEQQANLARLQEALKQSLAQVESGLAALEKVVGDKNYAEAGALVSKLTAFQLSPEQEQLFNSLKAQVSQWMSSQEGAAKAVNNLLGR